MNSDGIPMSSDEVRRERNYEDESELGMGERSGAGTIAGWCMGL
jgi:hypothetical protein